MTQVYWSTSIINKINSNEITHIGQHACKSPRETELAIKLQPRSYKGKDLVYDACTLGNHHKIDKIDNR